MWRRFARHCNERLRCCQHIRRSISFRNLAKYVKMCCCCLCKNLSFCFCLKVGIFIWIGRTRTHIVRGHYCQSSKEARSMARLCRHGKIIHFYNFVRMNNKQYRKKNNNNFFREGMQVCRSGIVSSNLRANCGAEVVIEADALCSEAMVGIRTDAWHSGRCTSRS